MSTQTTVLPKNLQLLTGRMANMQRTVIRQRPQSNDAATDGQTVHWRLPTNTLVDLHNLQIWGQALIQDGKYRGLPRDMSQIIERADIVVNGQVISGNNNDHGGLHHLLSQHLTDPDYFNAGEWLESGDNKTNITDNGSVATMRSVLRRADGTAYTDGTNEVQLYSEGESGSGTVLPKKFPFVIQGFLGFLGGSYVRFIDTAFLGPVEIRIRLAPGTVMYINSEDNGTVDQFGRADNQNVYRSTAGANDNYTIDGYQLQNLYMVMDTISFTDDFYRAILASRLETGQMITIPYQNFFSFQKALNSNSDTMTFNLATQSLDMLMVSFRDTRYNNRYAKGWSPQADNTNYYKFYSLDDASEHFDGKTTYQFMVNNLMMPTWPVTVNEAYMLTRAAFDLASDYSGAGGKVQNINDYKYGRFVFAQAFNHHSETDKIISGLDTRGASSNMSFQIDSAGIGTSPAHFVPSAQIFVWAVTTSTLEVGPGQNVTVIF